MVLTGGSQVVRFVASKPVDWASAHFAARSSPGANEKRDKQSTATTSRRANERA